MSSLFLSLCLSLHNFYETARDFLRSNTQNCNGRVTDRIRSTGRRSAAAARGSLRRRTMSKAGDRRESWGGRRRQDARGELGWRSLGIGGAGAWRRGEERPISPEEPPGSGVLAGARVPWRVRRKMRLGNWRGSPRRRRGVVVYRGRGGEAERRYAWTRSWTRLRFLLVFLGREVFSSFGCAGKVASAVCPALYPRRLG